MHRSRRASLASFRLFSHCLPQMVKAATWVAFAAILSLGGGTASAETLPPPAGETRATWAQDLAAAQKRHYEWLHSHPELSGSEQKTSEYLAREVKKLGFSVRSQVAGHGFVATLKNGPGKTLFLRTELDALPVREQTGLPYSSKKSASAAGGSMTPVMHACGHDLHMAAWLGAASFFSSHRDLWQGTLVLLAQPAEETLKGARALVESGILSSLPPPNLVFAIHAHDQLPVGTVGFTPGPFAASADSVTVTLYGKGGHGAYPETSVDPIVMAAEFVLSLQSIVSREVSPLESAVVTVGSIHGGAKNNVIPDEVRLELTVRTFQEKTRETVLAAIERRARAVAQSKSAPRAPRVEAHRDVAAAVNEPELTRRLAKRLTERLGGFEISELPPEMGSEDFAEYSRAHLPTVMLMVGTAAPSAVAKARAGGPSLDPLHSSTYKPEMPGALEAAIAVHIEVGLEILGR